MIVIDSSALVDALINPDGSVASRLGHDDLTAPELIDIEVVSAVRHLVLGRKLNVDRAGAVVAALAWFPLSRWPHRRMVDRIWQLRDNLSAYDATYVALAEHLGVPLLTSDRRLASASGPRCSIEVVR